MGKLCTQSKSWSRWATTQSYLHCLINTFNKAINLRMSSRTHNEFGIQFPRQRLPIFANKAGLSFRHNYLWNTMKSISMINKDNHGFISGNFSWYERKCAISDGKQGTIILVKWNSVLLVRSVTKSIPIISQGYSVTPRDTRQKNLARSGLSNCKHNNWSKELCTPTIYKRSLKRRFHKVVNMRCQFWWPTL